MLPHDFPKWQLVYYYFSKWKENGTIEVLQEHLVESRRKRASKNEEPTAAIIDAQSVRSTAVSSHSTGFDAAKRTKGRKRHIVVDTLGLLLCVVVHSAGMGRCLCCYGLRAPTNVLQKYLLMVGMPAS